MTDSNSPSVQDSAKTALHEFNEDGTPFSTDDYISFVIGTTIEWALHPTVERRHLHLHAEACLKNRIGELAEEARSNAVADFLQDKNFKIESAR